MLRIFICIAIRHARAPRGHRDTSCALVADVTGCALDDLGGIDVHVRDLDFDEQRVARVVSDLIDVLASGVPRGEAGRFVAYLRRVADELDQP